MVPREKAPLKDWSSRNLVAFSNWFSMSIVGFKVEILAFVNKMKVRKKARRVGRGRKILLQNLKGN